MPRGKKKSDKRRGEAGRMQTSDDDNDTPDNMSVVSGASDLSAFPEEDDGVDETGTHENFEDKLKEVIDMITQKSAKGRVNSLMSLRSALSKKFIQDFVVDRKITIQDALERCLKKGKGEEQCQAAICTLLLLLQLGASVDSEQIFIETKPVLTTIMADASASLKARGACADALGLGCFLAGSEIDHVVDTLKSLEQIFKASYFKGDKTPPSHSPQVTELHASALTAWGLLIPIAPASIITSYIKTILPKLEEMLHSSDVDLRIAAGETIALLYELARDDNPDFHSRASSSLVILLKELATDGSRHRAKKDRRHQRSSFRDILGTVVDRDSPSIPVKFGMEVLQIDDWVTKTRYDALCHCLGAGVNTHLAENDLVRDIFDLGPPIPTGNLAPHQKASKLERHLYNSAAFKARTKYRSKFRDKRVANHAD